jgi:hypothetical protein
LHEREYNIHDPGERNLLVHDWLSYAESGEKDLFSAYDAVAILIDVDPVLAWTIILEILHLALTESTFGLAAAGPFEDLLAFHGADVIVLIEQHADGDEVLREALRRVNSRSSDLDTVTLNRYMGLGVRRIG